jgi:hypothetical protein
MVKPFEVADSTHALTLEWSLQLTPCGVNRLFRSVQHIGPFKKQEPEALTL